ncbi:hypothetical protein WMY93_005298 [Mugilogobius chulae]|uniref:ADP-ribosylation factor-like protein 15 n=1 Tax=Mugilogobius chulae TaxID=88201 RepID=A0AAW0PR35_9GOBI
MDYLCFRALCCKGPPPPRPEYDVVCIGLTGAGKTSLLSRLCSEGSDGIIPTTGFSIKAVPFPNAILNVKELGGADKHQKILESVLPGVSGSANHQDKPAARTPSQIKKYLELEPLARGKRWILAGSSTDNMEGSFPVAYVSLASAAAPADHGLEPAGALFLFSYGYGHQADQQRTPN